MAGIDRHDVIRYLRWLADQPEGVKHRDVLFRAALIIDRDATIVFVPMTPAVLTERHGDQAI